MITKIRFLSSILIFLSFQLYAQEKFTVSGTVKDSDNGEDLIGATVFVKELNTGTASNEYGFFSITLPKGSYTFIVSYLGYQKMEQNVNLSANQRLAFNLTTESITTETVVITEKRSDANVLDVKMSNNSLDMKQLKTLPALFGEVDILKNIQTLPGIQNAGEGTTGFYVRGGSADQNLILLDEAPVYNPSHLLGFFSVFNSDVLKGVEIYKGGIPAQYGGRLSSLVDVRTIDGNNKKHDQTVSLGLISGKITLQGPIKKEKSSYVISGRRTWVDQFLKLSNDPDSKNNKLYFYDLNAKANFVLSPKDRVFVAGYFGRDVLSFGAFGLNWGNATGTARWNHIFNDKLFSNTTLVYSNFDYSFKISAGTFGFIWTSKLQETALKQDFTYYLTPKNELRAGISFTYRGVQPGKIVSLDSSFLKDRELDQFKAGEMAAYVSNDQKIGARLHLQYGVRFTTFSQIGATNVNVFQDNDVSKPVIGKKSYGNFENIQNYNAFEPRLSGRFLLNQDFSLKASYNRTAQFLHLLSNSTSPLPTAVWMPSTRYVKPQKADQVALGLFKNIKDNMYEFSVEGYYKKMFSVTDFKDNADLLLNERIEAEIRQGDGQSYGLEFFAKKAKGKLTGWVSYTLSKATRTIIGVNNNNEYRADYDRRHNLNVVSSYEYSKRLSFGAAWVYSTGRPFSVPAGQYIVSDLAIPYYSERNSYLMPAFHRLDVSVTLKSKEKVGRKWNGAWNFSIYNLYNRKNPFTVQVQDKTDDKGNKTGKKEIVMVWLFPIIPSVAYTITF